MAKVLTWCREDIPQVLARLGSSDAGLSQQEVTARLGLHGANVLPQPGSRTLFSIFLHQFKDPLIYILILAGILSVIVGDTKDAIFIFIIILINATLGTWQESKAENSAAALRKLVKTTARVRRSNALTQVDATELVPGDIVLLEAGSKVPADGRILEGNNLTVEEALLTGESIAIEKTADLIDGDVESLGDQVNMVFAATTVIRGHGVAVVTATGGSTEIGHIASSLAAAESEKPPLIRRMEAFSKRISIAVVVICGLLGLVGWSRGMPVLDIFFFMVAVGVSAIPEGLPVALTVALAVGTGRMAKKNVIIRRLPAVEGLGSCTLIASDKTGTLTMDKQSVETILLANGDRYRITGTGDSGDGSIEAETAPKDESLLQRLLTIAVLANESSMTREGDEWKSSGDAVDRALLSLAYKAGHDPAFFRRDIHIEKSIGYESDNKYSAVFYQHDGSIQFGMKGALEVILKHLDDNDRESAHRISEELAAAGYRVITIAGGKVDSNSIDELPTLKFIGCIGLIDPVRAESYDAIRQCRKAGVTVVMVTGDHPVTAYKIASELEIASDRSQVLTGRELEAIADREDASALVVQKSVFARVSPVQKQFIVESFKKMGQFVAVTGDGANDAPALKIAHIGIAMGGGTDLAKESASIIITDNNFASIASGVEEGRFTYDNLRKIIYLLISTGVAEIALVAIPLLIGMPLPFLAVQLLWLNLVTNGIQDIALAFEKGDPAVMQQPPRPPGESIFDRLMVAEILWSAFVMSAVTIGAWWWMITKNHMNEQHARTILMMLMVMLQNFHVINCRSERRSIFSLPVSHNRFVYFAILAAQIVHISAAFIPGLNDILKLDPIAYHEWMLLVPLALTILLSMEVFKWLTRRFRLL